MRLNKVTIYARITTVGYGQYTCISKTEKCTDCTHLPLEGTGVELRCFLGRVHNTTDRVHNTTEEYTTQLGEYTTQLKSTQHN